MIRPPRHIRASSSSSSPSSLARSIPYTDLSTPHPRPTNRQTGGLTAAGHDARVSPTRDSGGMDGAAECAAALDAARTRCHHGPSPGSAARGRTGRGAPTCNSARVSECKKGEEMRVCLFSSCATLINLNRNHMEDYFKNMTRV